MINLQKCDIEHIPLPVCTLGVADQGYRDENVDQLAQVIISNISNQTSDPSSKSYFKGVNNLEINQDKITLGQGEYVVFHKSLTGEKQPLSSETFEHVYQILLQHSPVALANSGAENAMEECANRYELLKAKLKEIDPTLEALFVPRTLYELFFIRKCIQEDLKHKKICSFLNPSLHTISLEDFDGDQQKYENYLRNKEVRQKERKCWHLCYFADTGDNQHAGVKNVAYRLNKAILKAFDPSSEGFTYQEFSALAKKEIKFLKAHYNNGLEIMEKLRRGEKVEHVSSCTMPGPTTNFSNETTRGIIKPMGIRNKADARIIRKAIALECSKLAQQSLFLYRGANFQNDVAFCWDDKDKPYSLSYGSSLFAGCLYDGGATAFHYMRRQQNAYAIPVAFNQLNESPFFVPKTHTVAQLFGDGEIFHARTKAWKDVDLNEIGGIDMGANSHIRDHLTSNLSQTELNSQFEAYKNLALQLK